jgi:hypothetical protein
MVQPRIRRRTRRALLVGAVATVALGALLPGVGVPVVRASPAHDKDKDRKKDKQERRHDDDDRVAEGQVLAIDTSTDPPELLVGTGDGEMVVRMLKTDEIALTGVSVGDYVRLEGEKIHELLFEAQQLDVSERYSELSPDEDIVDTRETKKKKKKD